MKKMIIAIAFAAISINASADDVMKKLADGTYVVNTTTLCQARGYKNTTPLEVYIKSGKVVKIEPLKNKETPKYFKKAVDGLFPQFIGLKISKALGVADAPKTDGCTGATLSGKALKQNVKAALTYYKKNK